MTEYLPGELPSHHDAPDSWDTCTEPPWNRQVRHGKKVHPLLIWAGCVLVTICLWSGVFLIVMAIWGVVE